MMGNKYVLIGIIVSGIVLGAGVVYTLRQHDLLRLLTLLSLACIAVVLMWQRE